MCAGGAGGELRSLALRTIEIRRFRNIESVDLRLGPRFNVISGDNGQGKTNVLEAVYVLATSRSFRTQRLGELVQQGGDSASIRAEIAEAAELRQQSIGLRHGVRQVRINGKRPPTLAAYAVQTPTVAFHSRAMELAFGGGRERRRLLDRVALYESPGYIAESAAYAHALRARQRVLETRGPAASDLDGWEELMARHGVCVSDRRASASVRLGPEALRAFASLGPSGLTLGMSYRRASPEDVGEFLVELRRNRGKDRARRSASVGPHRDDLLLSLSGQPVRSMASQGQQRAIVLALELAEICVIGSTRDVQPLLLMDDVSSELDRRTLSALLGALRSSRGQVLITTTRPEWIDTDGGSPGGGGDLRRDFHVESGRLSRS